MHKNRVTKLAHLILAALAVLVFLSTSKLMIATQIVQTAITEQEADSLFQSGEWSKAAGAYQAIANREPANSRAWFRLGMSLHSQGKYAEAITPYKRALDNKPSHLVSMSAMFRLVRVYSMMKERDTAFEWLNKALGAGFSQVETLKSDIELQNLRDDPRFKEVLAKAQANARPCSIRPQSRQFDFWIGEWDVQNRQGQPAGTNSVQLILGDCVIAENWTGAGGSSGKSFNLYDVNTGKWHQTWVSDRGIFTHYIGEFVGGKMIYVADSMQNNQKIKLRMTFTRLANGDVRQLGEMSNDDGKTWQTQYDLTYTRKN